jgi:RimJ/RimL family protein N-acetyltransferase
VPRSFCTDRLLIRSFTLEDPDAVHGVYGDEQVMRHVGDGTVADLAQTRKMVRDYIDHERRHGFSFWAVVERESDTVMGDAGLYLLEGTGPEVELGYTLGRAWWGRGYATEAARACLDLTWREFGQQEVVAVADPLNAASIHVLHKVGMRLDRPIIAYRREHELYRLTLRSASTTSRTSRLDDGRPGEPG